MTTRPTLFLTVGLPGTGKTTVARRIEVEQKALRLTKDEWVKALYGLANPPAASDVIEGRLIEIGMRALELPPAEQRRRLDRRQAEEPHTTWRMSDEELAEWAAIISIPTQGELDGSEPADCPPEGFASWEGWRGHRWPPSVP
jgi:hypothetical protein